MTKTTRCVCCTQPVPTKRSALGYRTCLICGETQARAVRHTVAPLHKSNYMLISNRADLIGLNNKGGLVK